MTNLGDAIIRAAVAQDWTVQVDGATGDHVLISPYTGAEIEIDAMLLDADVLRPLLVAVLDRAIEDGRLIWPWPPVIPYPRR